MSAVFSKGLRLSHQALRGFAVVVALCSVPTACADCTDNIEWSIRVTATDSISGAPVAAGLRAVARQGTFQEEFATFPGLPGELFFSRDRERAGVFDVVVTATGYREWRVSNVRVREDECHVITRTLQARLVPL